MAPLQGHSVWHTWNHYWMDKKMVITKPYSRGSYNKFDDKEQWIRISEGCPNNCSFCRETKECGPKPIYFPIPNIIRNHVKIMDMNLLYKPECIKILDLLGNQRVNEKVVYYELICGIDFRFMTQEKCDALKRNRFQNIRFAWDHSFDNQYKIVQLIKMLYKSGYTYRDLSCFMICNWKIPYPSNLAKVNLMKVWRIKICDCWFDNQLSPHIVPIYWPLSAITEFRKLCRKHNQLVNFGIDPEHKGNGGGYLDFD